MDNSDNMSNLNETTEAIEEDNRPKHYVPYGVKGLSEVHLFRSPIMVGDDNIRSAVNKNDSKKLGKICLVNYLNKNDRIISINTKSK
jgi:hypothetical protein